METTAGAAFFFTNIKQAAKLNRQTPVTDADEPI